MFSALEHGIRKRASKWLFKQRGPEAGEVFLHQRRVFIVPSHPGILFFVMLVVLFIASTNYNLSLGFAFTFVLGGCGLVDMHLTFRNIAHLHLAPGRTSPVFAGEDALFELALINRRNYDRYAIWLDFVHDNRPEVMQPVDIPANSQRTVSLATHAAERGWLQAPRVRLQTRFPLGLLRSWCYWQPALKTLVYPRPEDDAPPLPFAGTERGNGAGGAGQDEFAGIRSYQAGDSLKRLAWRQIAKVDLDLGGNLVTKHFEGGSATEVVINFGELPYSMDLESRLSRMARWVIEAEARGLPYAFRLGETHLPAALGPAHQEACLRALALFRKA
jgi:uncharacterized protein (DUF58 family)